MKSGTIFDLVEEDLPEGKEGYMELASRAQEPKDKSFFSNLKEYSKSALKGGIEGISSVGRMISPLQGEKYNKEDLTETLDYLIPTEDESYGQRSIRRGAQILPESLVLPGGSAAGTALRSVGAGFLSEGAKELGLPEWAQSAAELTAFVGPDVTKKLLETGKDKDLISFAKKMGMTDEQITPLIQPEFKQKWLSKLAKKTGSTEESLRNTKSGISNIYTSLQNSTAAKTILSDKQQKDLLNSLSAISQKMPSAVRNKIKEDIVDLLKKPIDSESLMNLYADINYNLGDNAKQLSLFKKPIRDAIAASSPKLGKDFDMVNDLYGKYHKISSKLKPTLKDQVINAVESVALLGGIAKGILFSDYSVLVGTLGEMGARNLAKKMLTNPRYQQLSQKMIIALNQNKYRLASRVIDDLREQLKKDSPEAVDEMKSLTLEEFEKLSNPTKQTL